MLNKRFSVSLLKIVVPDTRRKQK